jgi:hypothetical protein
VISVDAKAEPASIVRRKFQMNHDSPLIQISREIVPCSTPWQATEATAKRRLAPACNTSPTALTGNEARTCNPLNDRSNSFKVQVSVKKRVNRRRKKKAQRIFGKSM